MPNGATATAGAWLFGLQQNAENRTNLALVNTGETDASTVGLRVDLYDGGTGSIASSFDVSLEPKKWTQFNAVLSPGISNGYARITRTGGTNAFLAYAVVVDGGAPQTRSDDGAFVSFQVEEPPASPELLAIRKVEAKAKSLLAAGVRRLDHVRAVADFMATLPEYAVTGVDPASQTAFGVFATGASTSSRTTGTPGRSTRATAGRAAARPLPRRSCRGPVGRACCSRSGTDSGRRSRCTTWPPCSRAHPAATRFGSGGSATRGSRCCGRSPATGTSTSTRTEGGASGRRTIPVRGYFSLQSSTLVTPGTEALPEIAADFAAGRLTYFTAPNFDQVVDPATGNLVDDEDTRYGITGEFVKAYWHLAPDSIVFLNACWSAYTSDPEGPQDFIDACWAANAGVYFGWDEKATPGTCYKTVRYFTDRLIGANKYRRRTRTSALFRGSSSTPTCSRTTRP